VEDYNVIAIGKVQKPDEWEMPEGVHDLTNLTTIDDCIRLFTRQCDLAVGGSSGLLHLASRCGRPQLSWGGQKSIVRFAEVNWFAADYKVYNWGWTRSRMWCPLP